MAGAIYDITMRKGASELSPMLCSSECVSDLAKLDRDAGPVSSYRILSVDSGTFGLPVLVEVSVERNGRTRTESLVRHSFGPFNTVSRAKQETK